MEAAEREIGEENLYREEKYAAKYEINMLRCIFCGFCEEACPKDAIYLSETFAPQAFYRKNFIYGKEDLLIPNPVTEPEAFAKAKGAGVKTTVNQLKEMLTCSQLQLDNEHYEIIILVFKCTCLVQCHNGSGQ